MKLEIPVFTRCCFCFPLLNGLIVWAFLKLISDAFIIALMMYSMMWNILDIKVTRSDDDVLGRIEEQMFLPVTAVALFVVDFLVTMAFIVGGHKKSIILVKAFYFISMVMWIFTMVLTAALIFLMIDYTDLDLDFWITFTLKFAIYFLALVVQTYFIFLLRSEVIKLKNIGEISFENNAAEADCTMKIEEVAAAEETKTEHV